MGDDGQPIETTVVTMEFDAVEPSALLAVLARYVVMARGAEGCRNIDLCSSSTTPERFVVISKWSSPTTQRAHFDDPTMVEMAEACAGLLAARPRVDLWEGISAHDLA